MMPEDEYDLAGYSTGVVDRSKVLDKNTEETGDVLIALPSTGVHSNGFSLVRKVFDIENADLNAYVPELGASLGETLLTPTKIYVKPMLTLFDEVNVKAVAHITGGGFYENIPRALKDGLSANIALKDVKVLPIFDLIREKGGISEHDMFNTFNMGVGMVAVVAPADAEKAIEVLKNQGIDAYRLGELVESDEGVILY